VKWKSCRSPICLVGNNLPAIIQSGNVQSYVKNVKISLVANAGAQTTVETDMLTTA